MSEYKIMAVVINHRSQSAPIVQRIFSENGCIIKTRLGLHEAGDVCSDEGLVILNLSGSDEEVNDLKNKLVELDGVRVEVMKL